MDEIFLIIHLALVPNVEPTWLTNLYEVEFATKPSCDKVLDVLEVHNLHDVSNMHCVKIHK